MNAVIIRLVCGAIFLIAVWFATWPFESGDWFPLGFVAVAGIAVSGVLSWWSLVRRTWRKWHVAVFAAPFILPVALSLAGIAKADFYPTIYWSLAGLLTVGLCFVCDRLAVRLADNGARTER